MKIIFVAFMLTCLSGFTQASAEGFEELAKRKAAEGYMFPAAPKYVPYSYTVTFLNEGMNGDENMAFAAKYRVKPNAVAGERITYLGENEAGLPEDIQAEIEQVNHEKTMEEFAEEFWCSDVDEPEALDLSDGVVLSEDAETAVISLSNAKVVELMDDGDMPKKIRKRLVGETTFSKSDFYPMNTRIWLSKPTTVKVVAKMKEMAFETSCAKAPNGHFYNASTKVRIRLKVMGKAIVQDTRITISDLSLTAE
ncbi:MAG: hypothetical protein ACPGVT_03555 [Maricaulaceae bacterium]